MMSENPPPQFTLRTLLLVMTAVAVVCSLVAVCGLTGYDAAILLGLILAVGMGTFVGLLICSYAGLGFGFEDLKWEVFRCLAVGAITVLSGHVLVSLSAGLILVVPLLMVICIKVFWPEVAGVEIMIVGFSAMSAAGILLAHVAHWTGG